MANNKVKAEDKVSKEQKLLDRISDFLVTNKVAVTIAAAAVVVVVVLVVVITATVNGSNNKKVEAVAALEDRYYTLAAKSKDDADYSEVEKALVADIEKSVKGNDYSAVKAQYLLGLVNMNSQNWNAACDSFMSVSKLGNKSYLAPLATINAAVCKEESGDLNGALDLFKQASEFADAGVTCRALFNVGRIYLQQGNTALAKATFQQVADRTEASEYKALAKNILATM